AGTAGTAGRSPRPGSPAPYSRRTGTRAPRPAGRRYLDVAVGHVVPDGVVDEVSDKAFRELPATSRDGRGKVYVQPQAAARRLLAAIGDDPASHLREIKRLMRPQPALAH